jgi:hypothetical protein
LNFTIFLTNLCELCLILKIRNQQMLFTNSIID